MNPPSSPLTEIIPPQMLVAAAVVAAILLGLAAAVHYTLNGPRAKLRRRIGAVIGAPAKSGKAQGKAASGGGARKKAIQNKLRELEKARGKKRGYKLREQLQQAGLSMGVQRYAAYGALAGAVGGGLYHVLDLPLLGLPFFMLTMGLGLPKMVLGMMVSRRQKKFTLNFADAIDVIVRGIRSGLPVGECLNIIARELPDPVGPEFKLIVEGQRLGMTLDEALQRGVTRMPTPELKFFAIVLSIQQQTGGNLADTLSKLSDVLRSRKRMRDRIQAMSSEAKSSAGIIGSLPLAVGGILSVVAPEYIAELFTTGTGHMLLGVGVCIMGVGVFIMRQMINFDI